MVKSFMYGSLGNESLKMIRHAEQAQTYFYVLNGRGLVTALIDQHAKGAEAYLYDVFGQPFLSKPDNKRLREQLSSSAVENPHLLSTWLYDSDAAVYAHQGNVYDPSTKQLLSGFLAKSPPVR